MEFAIQEHLLWAYAPDEEKDSAIELFGRQLKLVPEVEYYLTILSLTNIHAIHCLEENGSQKNMQSANLAIEETVTGHSSMLQLSEHDAPSMRSHGREIHANLETQGCRVLTGCQVLCHGRHQCTAFCYVPLSLDGVVISMLCYFLGASIVYEFNIMFKYLKNLNFCGS